MTAATTAPAAALAASPDTGVTAAGLLRSEWIKFWTLRSTIWTLGLTVVLMVGLAVLFAFGAASSLGETDPEDPGVTLVIENAAGLIGMGTFLAQIAVAVLGVLTITGEYSTGMIRSTLTAAPRRIPALWAKVAVVAASVTAVAIVSAALGALLTLGFHDRLGITLDLTDGETQRLIAGIPLYLAGLALLGLAFGALLRSSAGAIATVLGLTLLLEAMIAAIPFRIFEVISPFLPTTAGQRILTGDATLAELDAVATGATLGPWQGYAVLLAWVAVLLGIAAVLLRRRDA